MDCSHAALLILNGPVVNESGLSVLRPGATTLGIRAQSSIPNLVATGFSVPAGENWNVSDISFYSYQTGASGFTFQTATWSVISGDVNTGTIVASGTTNLTNAGLVGYRVTSATLSNTDRAIFEANADVTDFSLSAGDYFLRWGLTGSLSSGPWQPPTSDGAIGNSFQSLAGGPFAPWVDGGDSLGAVFPFAMYGTATTTVEPGVIPEPASVLGLGFLLTAALGLRSRRHSTLDR